MNCCESLWKSEGVSLFVLFMWPICLKNQGVLVKFHPKRKVRREFYQGLTLGKLALTNVLNNLLLWHSFFFTHAKRTATCKWIYTVDQLARPHLQCWTKDTRTPMHVGKYRGVPDKKLGSLSNDDGDANENGRKAIGINWQNNHFARASSFSGQTVKTLIDLFSRFPPSLRMLYNSWDKSDVTWYFRGQTSDKIC